MRAYVVFDEAVWLLVSVVYLARATLVNVKSTHGPRCTMLSFFFCRYTFFFLLSGGHRGARAPGKGGVKGARCFGGGLAMALLFFSVSPTIKK